MTSPYGTTPARTKNTKKCSPKAILIKLTLNLNSNVAAVYTRKRLNAHVVHMCLHNIAVTDAIVLERLNRSSCPMSSDFGGPAFHVHNKAHEKDEEQDQRYDKAAGVVVRGSAATAVAAIIAATFQA